MGEDGVIAPCRAQDLPDTRFREDAVRVERVLSAVQLERDVPRTVVLQFDETSAVFPDHRDAGVDAFLLIIVHAEVGVSGAFLVRDDPYLRGPELEHLFGSPHLARCFLRLVVVPEAECAREYARYEVDHWVLLF